jgi:hypothetical protein
MQITLFINHIVVGTIEENYYTGGLTPDLKTYIKHGCYSILMDSYQYDYDKSIFKVIYCLKTSYSDRLQTNDLYEFDALKEMDAPKWEKTYHLKKINKEKS